MAVVRPGDRKKTGMRGGKFPVATVAQCLSAIKLRGKGKGVSKSAVLNHVGRSPCAKNPRVKAALARARAVDSGSKPKTKKKTTRKGRKSRGRK